MRATCEACGHVQPPDWKPGDLCTNCGTVVRREKRCHWCVQLTPDGNYCRHCGGGLVPDAQYGAARWLKHLGSDQFVIPDRLTAMDPEQVAHFERLYQRHAIVAERHIDDLAFAEGFLRQRGWARSLEAELLPLLPMADDALKALVIAPLRGTTDAEKLLEIRVASPFGRTQALAALARLRLWQTDTAQPAAADPTDLEWGLTALGAPDEAARLEAALTLSHWRVVSAPGSPPYQPLIDILQNPELLPLETAVHLALMQSRRTGQAQPLPAAALGAEDSNLAFAAALASYDIDRLRAALRVPARRFAAAYLLTALEQDFDLAPLLPELSVEECKELFQLIRQQKRPRPDLRTFLAAAVQDPHRYETPTVRELQLLALRPGDAPRLVREYGYWNFILQVFRSPLLPPEDLEPVCHELVLLNLFHPREVAPLREIFGQGRLPLSFVPNHFMVAPGKSFEGLLDLAQEQLSRQFGPEIQALHTYLRDMVWNESIPAALRTRICQLLNQWYEDFHSQRIKPAFSAEWGTAYFGSFANFAAYYLHGLENLGQLEALGVQRPFLEHLSTMARLSDALAATAYATVSAPVVGRWRAALVALVRTPHYDYWHAPAIQVLSQLQHHAPWQKSVRAELASLLGVSNHNTDYAINTALGIE